MNSDQPITWHRALAPWAIASLAICFIAAQARAQGAPPPVPNQEQPEVLTRGPVHEAFAEPVNMEFDDAQVAPSEPPANIQEVPPDDRPEGDHFIWVPGYWSWAPERNNYIWVSACWRAAPPNMSWTPGYWSQTTGGWEWVAGFWSPEDAQEVEYLPTPPALDRIEPAGSPPNVDDVWVPPCAYWSDGRYVERPGYWLKSQPGWMWVASHYVWTPRGYVFCPGHWDYPLEDRGILFAPVAIAPAEYSRRGYLYTPSVVVDVDVLSANLFVSFHTSHYFFGDYYDDDAVKVGIVPWFDRRSSRTWYDPMYEYNRASLRISISDWDQRQRHEFEIRRSDRNLRPPRTYRELETRIAQAPVEQRNKIQVVQSFKTVVNNTTVINKNTTVNNTTVNNNKNTVNNSSLSKVKFEKIDPAAKEKITKQAADHTALVEQRKKREGPAAGAKPANVAKPAATPQAAPKEPTPQLAGERKEPAAPEPAARPAPTPAERGRAAATPQAEPAGRGAPAQPEARPTPTPGDRGRDAATPAADRKPAAQREVRVSQPEKEKLSDAQPAGRGKPTAAGKAPPPQPTDEAKRKGDPKDSKDDPKTEEKPATRPAGRGGR